MHCMAWVNSKVQEGADLNYSLLDARSKMHYKLWSAAVHQHLHEDFFPPRLHLPMHPLPPPQPLCTSRFTSKNAFVPYFASKPLIFQEVQQGEQVKQAEIFPT